MDGALISDSRTVVHIFSDDPDYLDHYSSRWQDQRTTFALPRVSFGPGFTGQYSSRDAAASQMAVPRPHRLTSVVSFAVDVWIMVEAAEFVGSTGSTVMDLVQGLRSGSPLPRRVPSCIGNWPILGRVTNEARACISTLARAYSTTHFDPEGVEILPEHRHVLDSLMPHALDAADAYLSKQLDRAGGSCAMSNLGRGVLEAHTDLMANRDTFRKTSPESASAKRWLTAMIGYRLNPYLTSCGKGYIYTPSSKDLTKVSTMQIPGSARATGSAASASSAGAAVQPGAALSRVVAPSRAPDRAVSVPERKRPRVVPPPTREPFTAGATVAPAPRPEHRPLMPAKSKAVPKPAHP